MSLSSFYNLSAVNSCTLLMHIKKRPLKAAFLKHLFETSTITNSYCEILFLATLVSSGTIVVKPSDRHTCIPPR